MEVGEVDIESERVLEKKAEKDMSASVISRNPLTRLPAARFSGGILESVITVKRKHRKNVKK